MNGAQSLIQTLVYCGVDTCFANPGTSEMHLVAALDTVRGLRPVLCLFEGVATGAADGYGRVAGNAARAVQAARSAPGGIATLILSADAAWNPAEHAAERLPDIGPAIVKADSIEDIAKLISSGKKTAMLLRGRALAGDGLEAAGRIHAKTGARLLCDTFAPHAEMGAGRVSVERIPYFGEQVTAFLSGTEQMIMVASTPPVSFFAYPGKPSWCVPDMCELIYLAHPHEDASPPCRTWPTPWERRRRHRPASHCSCRGCQPAR